MGEIVNAGDGAPILMLNGVDWVKEEPDTGSVTVKNTGKGDPVNVGVPLRIPEALTVNPGGKPVAVHV